MKIHRLLEERNLEIKKTENIDKIAAFESQILHLYQICEVMYLYAT